MPLTRSPTAAFPRVEKGVKFPGDTAPKGDFNLSALWLFGVPLSAVLAFYFKLGVMKLPPPGAWFAVNAARPP